MGLNINKVTCAGHLVADPEVRFTGTGKAVCNLRICVNQMVKGNQKKEFVNIVLWEKQAVSAGQYLTKGRNIYVEGYMQTRKWDDRDGNTRYTTEVIARFVNYLDSGKQDQQQTQSQDQQEIPGIENEPIESEETAKLFT